MSIPNRIFLLSPAFCGGKRAGFLLNDAATFDLAVRLRGERGAMLGEIFSFLSGLYFRGKLTYARRFARPPRGTNGVWIITPDRGLAPPELPMDVSSLRAMAAVPVDTDHPPYREPLEASAATVARTLGDADDVILLGSIATGKYVDVLSAAFGPRLKFPTDFVGRGDMSRGGLLLRRVAEQRELDYRAIAGATRRGKRPVKLAPMRVARIKRTRNRRVK